MTDPVPERVRVTSPRQVGTRAARTGASEIDAQTQLGELYMSSLLRSQGRLAATVLVALVVLVGGLPLLFTWVPSLADLEVFGMPLPWVLLGFAVYPVMFGLGWFYVRASERTERDFTDVVER